MNARDTDFDLAWFHTIITPRGIRRRRGTLLHWLMHAHQSIIKVLFLVRLALQQQSFGLTFGHLWLVLEPALQAFTYFLLIKIVFGVSGNDVSLGFFFIGVTFWRSHAIIVTSSPYLLLTKGQLYVEQNMTLETAYLEFIGQEVLLFLIRCVVLVAFLIAAKQMPSPAWLFAIPIGIVMFTFSTSVALFLSVMGLYFRDSGKFIGHIVWLWWYMSPGLYTIHRVPDWFLPIYRLNPFAHIFPALHDCILADRMPPLLPLLLIFAGSVCALVCGWCLVKKAAYQIARHA